MTPTPTSLDTRNAETENRQPRRAETLTRACQQVREKLRELKTNLGSRILPSRVNGWWRVTKHEELSLIAFDSV